LQNYQTEVSDLNSKVLAFNITVVPRSHNQEVDLLANVASHLIPAEGFQRDSFTIELIFRPSILDNITNWHVFNDDQQIIDFLHSEGIFQDVFVDELTSEENLHNVSHTQPNDQ
jgi:hypothetical protein